MTSSHKFAGARVALGILIAGLIAVAFWVGVSAMLL